MVLACDEDIIRFQIIMQHARSVQIVCCREQLPEDTLASCPIGMLGKIFGKRASIDILHDDGSAYGSIGLVSIDMYDIRM